MGCGDVWGHYLVWGYMGSLWGVRTYGVITGYENLGGHYGVWGLMGLLWSVGRYEVIMGCGKV